MLIKLVSKTNFYTVETHVTKLVFQTNFYITKKRNRNENNTRIY